MLESTWAAGSQAGNAQRLRGELANHLASVSGELDGRIVIQSFRDKMEGMMIGLRQSSYAAGNQTLIRYLRVQLRILRDESENRRGLDDRQL